VIASLRRAFSDFHLEIQDLAVAGGIVWARLVATGTNDGPCMGHPPTGRPMQVDVFDAVRVVDGRMVDHWAFPTGWECSSSSDWRSRPRRALA
jgi:predicted ester cyclase